MITMEPEMKQARRLAMARRVAESNGVLKDFRNVQEYIRTMEKKMETTFL